MRSLVPATATIFALLLTAGCETTSTLTGTDGPSDSIGENPMGMNPEAAGQNPGSVEMPRHFFSSIIQSDEVSSADFVLATMGKAIFEIDPRRLDDFVPRTVEAPRGIVDLVRNRYDDTVLALTRRGGLYQSDGLEQWTIWTHEGTVPLEGSARCTSIQQSVGVTGDFVITDSAGGIYEVDPRDLDNIVPRTSDAPLGIVSLTWNGYNDTMLALTREGELHESDGLADWTIWPQVGTLPLLPGANAVDGVQSADSPTSDFVFVDDIGGVYEADPRHLGTGVLRTTEGPAVAAAITRDRWDDTLLVLTRDGRLYQSDGWDEWITWNLVGSFLQ